MALAEPFRAESRYHRSKRAADDALLSLIPQACVVQPSLVFGPHGRSARLFAMLASFPLIPLPGGGHQHVQPIHLDDLIEAVVELLEGCEGRGSRIALVGPRPITLRTLLLTLRAGMRLPGTRVMSIPRALMDIAAHFLQLVPSGLLDVETWRMLERGNTADASATERLLRRPPRPASTFIDPRDAETVRTTARLSWLLPLLRTSVALVWIATGIVSLGLFPIEASLALLARTGAPPSLAPWLLYGAATIDLAFGILVFALHGKGRQMLWRAQAALIVAYSVIIAIWLPEYWLHPYGPMLKNIPLLAVLVLLDVMEERR
jgi:hypothetical protein